MQNDLLQQIRRNKANDVLLYNGKHSRNVSTECHKNQRRQLNRIEITKPLQSMRRDNLELPNQFIK